MPVTEATITCPECGTARRETMPENACQHFYTCTSCGTTHLKNGAFPQGDLDDHVAAHELASEIATRVEGRLRSKAKKIAEDHRWQVGQAEMSADDSRGTKRRARLMQNALMFALMLASEDEDDPPSVDAGEWWRRASARIFDWRFSLEGPFAVGYAAITDLGVLNISSVERVETQQLLAETVNDIVIAHLEVVDDIAALRKAVPACFGYALHAEDVRARELLSRFQRHSGTTIALPNDATLSTLLLDSMEHAQPPRDERPFFRIAASASFHVGIGAAVEDALADG